MHFEQNLNSKFGSDSSVCPQIAHLCLVTVCLGVLPRFGDYKLKDIKAREIEAWFISLDSVKMDNHNLSNGTKNCILSTLREVLDDAVKEGLVESNEARKVKSMPKRTKRKGSLSKQDLDKLFPNDNDELERIYGSRQMAMFFLIFLDTGFRPCEILALRYEQIRPDRTVYTEYMYEQETKKVVHRLKTSSYGKKYKVGVLSERTVNYIGAGQGNIFDLNSMNQIKTYRMFKRVVRNVLGIENVTQYALRHAFMTNLKYKYPKELIMELMGHTQWEECYDDSTPEMIMDNIRKALIRNQVSESD